jgi:uncharacterized protein (TIGR00369 family)
MKEIQPFSNSLQKTVARFMELPKSIRLSMLSYSMGNMIKYVGTSRVRFEKLTDQEVIVSLPNKRKTQNHIGQIHAAAMLLLAETATGIVVAMNVQDTSVPVIKSIKADFVKRSKGGMQAVATLTQEQMQEIRTTEKGEIAVKVKITDSEEREPILVEAIWAWTPKQRTTT